MAGLSSIPISKTLKINLPFDDDADRTVSKNIDAGSTVLHAVMVDNTGYATLVYISLWDDTDPVIGTDGQFAQFPVPASEKRVFYFGDLVLKNGLSWACSTAGGTTATGAPATPPDIYAVTSGGA